MLQAIAIVSILLWVLGRLSSFTMGGFIDVLLLIGLVAVLGQLIQGKRSVD
jgi:hypothetical protein